jgi:hypothetical protein
MNGINGTEYKDLETDLHIHNHFVFQKGSSLIKKTLLSEFEKLSKQTKQRLTSTVHKNSRWNRDQNKK